MFSKRIFLGHRFGDFGVYFVGGTGAGCGDEVAMVIGVPILSGVACGVSVLLYGRGVSSVCVAIALRIFWVGMSQ